MPKGLHLPKGATFTKSVEECTVLLGLLLFAPLSSMPHKCLASANSTTVRRTKSSMVKGGGTVKHIFRLMPKVGHIRILYIRKNQDPQT